MSDRPVAPSQVWPISRAGLLFLWENADASNTIGEPGDARARVCRVTPRDAARLGRYHQMVPSGGRFVADPASARAVTDGGRRTGAFTIEAVVTPQDPERREPGSILVLVSKAAVPLVQLVQEGRQLQLRLRTDASGGGREFRVSLSPLAAAKPHHLVVSYARQRQPERLIAVLNGRRLKLSSAVQGGLGNWTAGELSFGGLGGAAGWSGHLEGVALYDRAFSAAEAARSFQAYAGRLAGRTDPPRLIVQARLLQTTRLLDVSAYSQLLVVYRYQVAKVLQGTYSGKTLLVAHRGILNGKVQTAIRDRKVGSSVRLVLEPFDDHPELESIQIVEVDSEDAFDLPLFYALETE